VAAVDADPKWAAGNDELKDFFVGRNLSFELKQAEAAALPFPDNSFDAVTCQTVLIHLKDPHAILREMKRVLKPGGLLCCAEPNNLVASVLKDSLGAADSVEECVERFIFGLVKEKGKIALGEGDNSLGDRLAGFFAELGLRDIRSYLSDKTNFVIPPYDTPEMRAMIELKTGTDFEDFLENETKKQFAAFGGAFDPVLQKMSEKLNTYQAELKDALENRAYSDGGATLMYLVSGRK
jgi:SAM-dependent methyltransferase